MYEEIEERNITPTPKTLKQNTLTKLTYLVHDTDMIFCFFMPLLQTCAYGLWVLATIIYMDYSNYNASNIISFISPS